MKIKANSKINRLDTTTAPCSRVEFHQLKDGQNVEVDESVGKFLIENGFAAKSVASSKSKSKEKK